MHRPVRQRITGINRRPLRPESSAIRARRITATSPNRDETAKKRYADHRQSDRWKKDETRTKKKIWSSEFSSKFKTTSSSMAQEKYLLSKSGHSYDKMNSTAAAGSGTSSNARTATFADESSENVERSRRKENNGPSKRSNESAKDRDPGAGKTMEESTSRSSSHKMKSRHTSSKRHESSMPYDKNRHSSSNSALGEPTQSSVDRTASVTKTIIYAMNTATMKLDLLSGQNLANHPLVREIIDQELAREIQIKSDEIRKRIEQEFAIKMNSDQRSLVTPKLTDESQCGENNVQNISNANCEKCKRLSLVSDDSVKEVKQKRSEDNITDVTMEILVSTSTVTSQNQSTHDGTAGNVKDVTSHQSDQLTHKHLLKVESIQSSTRKTVEFKSIRESNATQPPIKIAYKSVTEHVADQLGRIEDSKYLTCDCGKSIHITNKLDLSPYFAHLDKHKRYKTDIEKYMIKRHLNKNMTSSVSYLKIESGPGYQVHKLVRCMFRCNIDSCAVEYTMIKALNNHYSVKHTDCVFDGRIKQTITVIQSNDEKQVVGSSVIEDDQFQFSQLFYCGHHNQVVGTRTEAMLHNQSLHDRSMNFEYQLKTLVLETNKYRKKLTEILKENRSPNRMHLFECLDCQNYFNSLEAVGKHYQKVNHESDVRFMVRKLASCSVCGVVSTLEGLEKHHKIAHKDAHHKTH